MCDEAISNLLGVDCFGKNSPRNDFKHVGFNIFNKFLWMNMIMNLSRVHDANSFTATEVFFPSPKAEN